MKQCPSCRELFGDQETFCDLDGAVLYDQEEVLRASLVQDQPTATAEMDQPRSSSPWAIGVVGLMIGVVLCAFVYLLLVWPDQKTKEQDGDHRTIKSQETTPTRAAQIAAVPLPTTSPTPETPAETPGETEAQAVASPASSTTIPAVSANLNEQPVSTGEKTPAETKHTVIIMKDGSSVEADAAWQDSQGIWFRRSGVVSFVDSDRVERITEVSQARANSPDTPKP